MELIFFGLAAVSLISGVLVVFQIHPLRSALWLIVNFFAVAGIYLLLHAEFIAAIQIIVYAGAIMVLFLFVIMLLNLREPEGPRQAALFGPEAGGHCGEPGRGLLHCLWPVPGASDPGLAGCPRPRQH